MDYVLDLDLGDVNRSCDRFNAQISFRRMSRLPGLQSDWRATSD